MRDVQLSVLRRMIWLDQGQFRDWACTARWPPIECQGPISLTLEAGSPRSNCLTRFSPASVYDTAQVQVSLPQ